AGRRIPVAAALWSSMAICLDLRRCGWVQDTGLDTVQAPSQAGEAMMAQKVTVALEDDLTGGPADQTVRVAVEGTGYEIDLTAKNAAGFRTLLAPYVQHARKAGRTAASRQRSGDIRAWAQQHGMAVSERGRIPASVMEQYDAAGGH